MSSVDWSAANQRLLVAEFARLRARIAGVDTSDADPELDAARASLPGAAAIDVLADAFALSEFERDIVLLCAGVEMDATLAAACALHGGGAGQPYATLGLALARLANPHWSALTPIGPLRRLQLVEVRDERALRTSRISLQERVLHYLAGVNYLDPRLRSLLREHQSVDALAPSHERTAAAAVAALNANDATTVVHLIGDDPCGQSEVAHKIAARCALRLRILRGADVPANADESDCIADLWNRESTLLGSALLVQAGESDPSVVARFVERLSGLTFVAAPQGVAPPHGELCVPVRRLDAAEQKQLWKTALGASATLFNGSIDAVVAQFRLRTGDIVRTAHALRDAPHEPEELERALWRACRHSAGRRLDDLAQRVAPTATWQDLVLPEQQITTLRQIAAHVRQRLKVYECWGFARRSARGLGISVLFSGESGTGKTMAAEVLANELQVDLYRIDLSSMVSKYIGETEKNLRRVFDAAEDSGAILLFDEADALFGKRSEVKDSHDRYANIEVSYLLQRMETYRGLAILTTNLKGALDTAFQRRLRFVVQFPFPDSQLRERIWREVFPPDTPLAAIDHARLAQLNVAGGNIRNIAMNAAFLAADADAPVGMSHLLQAARSEAGKRDRPFSDAEMRGWV